MPGGMFDENNKLQKDVLHFVPPKPIREFRYLCDKKFRTELIEDLYQVYEDYGVLYLAGCEYTFYVLNGKDLYEITRTTRKKLPRTHKRGGQSQNRIARLRDEAIHNYLVKINELCVDYFIDPETSLPKIKGFIVIGSGNKKVKFQDKLDPRIRRILLGVFTSDQLDCEIVLNSVNGFIRQKHLNIVKDVLDSGNKLEYGEKEVIEAIQEGFMESVIITPDMEKRLKKKNINIKQMCEDVSCTFYVIYENTLASMGGIIGKKWW